MNDADFKGHRERLRKRFINSGLDSFHDHEVLELVLTFAIPRKDVKSLAKLLLKEFGSLSAVFEAPPEMLKKIPGVGAKTALLLNLIFQVFSRYERDKRARKRTIKTPSDALDFLRPLVDQPYECLWAVALNSSNEILGTEMIQKGSINKISIIPRLVVEMAIKYKATALILSHNHPSGNCHPSRSDINITEILNGILSYLDITLLDHIIISRRCYFSFSEHGLIKPTEIKDLKSGSEHE